MKLLAALGTLLWIVFGLLLPLLAAGTENIVLPVVMIVLIVFNAGTSWLNKLAGAVWYLSALVFMIVAFEWLTVGTVLAWIAYWVVFRTTRTAVRVVIQEGEE